MKQCFLHGNFLAQVLGYFETWFLKHLFKKQKVSALAMDRFSSSGLKQKSFSPEWKEIYLLWIHGQDAIEFIPPLAIFVHTDFVPVFLLKGHCQHPKNHYHPDSLLYFLHPQSHCKSNPCTGAGLSSAPLPFSGSHIARKPTPLLDPSLQRHPDTLLHQSQAFHVWWAAGHKRMEMRMTLAGCLCIGVAPLAWAGQAHSSIPCSRPAQVGPIRCCECAKLLPAATVCKQAGNKQKT